MPSINTQFYPSTSYFTSIPTGYEEEGGANLDDNGLHIWMFDGEPADAYLKADATEQELGKPLKFQQTQISQKRLMA